MRLVTFRGSSDEPRCGAVLHDERIVDLTELCASLPVSAPVVRRLNLSGLTPASGGILRVLQAGDAALETIAAALAPENLEKLQTHLLVDTRLLAPVPRPGKIVAVARNYAAHAMEGAGEVAAQPRIIAKLSSSVAPPEAWVERPRGVQKMDFEVELAVVIGRYAHRVARAQAMEAVAGYTILNDLSAREFQVDVTPPQTTFAKSMNGFCPLGPWLVTKDEIPDPQALTVSTRVNGMLMQQGSTADMIFPIDYLIEYISRYMTLEPGDVISTGTPAGVGAYRIPPVWLQPGDRLRLEISKIGALTHEVV